MANADTTNEAITPPFDQRFPDEHAEALREVGFGADAEIVGRLHGGLYCIQSLCDLQRSFATERAAFEDDGRPDVSVISRFAEDNLVQSIKLLSHYMSGDLNDLVSVCESQAKALQRATANFDDRR